MAEGVKLLEEALAHHADVESVYWSAGAPAGLLDAALERGARVFELGAGVLDRVADTVTPQPVMTVVRRAEHRLDALAASDLLVVMAGVRDPGNAGTVLRAAWAAGAAGVVVCEGSVDPFNPKTVRASAGAVFGLPVVV
ncbi:MAG TPA: RNA methyltransferase, partial [Acidimicrobiales bacterium]|nr:RNA methyltransferase [Acidimicrobiales bacterium]